MEIGNVKVVVSMVMENVARKLLVVVGLVSVLELVVVTVWVKVKGYSFRPSWCYSWFNHPLLDQQRLCMQLKLENPALVLETYFNRIAAKSIYLY